MKHSIQQQRLLIPIITLLLTSCAAMTDDPYLKDVLTREKSETLSEDDPRYLQVNYLGRFLLDSDERNKFVALANNKDVMNSWSSAAQFSTAASMATDVAVGELGSSLGGSIGTATFIVGGALNAIFDGSQDYASAVYLPNTFNGQPLNTEEAAKDAAIELAHKQIEHVANALGGWNLQCINDCNSHHQLWQLEQGSGQPLSADYLYRPSNIVVMIGIRELEAVPDNSPLRSFVSKDIAWSSKSINGFYLGIYEPMAFDDDGLAKLFTPDDSELQFLVEGKRLVNTRVGANILRTLNSTPYTMWGTIVGKNRFYYEGEQYHGNDRFDDRVLDANLLTQNRVNTSSSKEKTDSQSSTP